MSGDFQLGVPRAVLLALLHQHHGPYSHEQACISLMLDRDAGGEKSIRDYVRIWGWTKAKVEYNIGRVRGDVDRWEQARRTEPRPTLANKTAAGQQQDSRQDKKRAKPDAITDSQDSEQDDHRTGHRTLTNHTHSQKEEESGGPREREALPEINPWDPVMGYPQEADVVRYAIEQGADPEMAAEIYSGFVSAGWHDWRNAPIRHWGHAVLNSIRSKNRRSKTNGHAAHQPNTPGKPGSSYERRLNVDVATVARNLAGMANGRQGTGRAAPGDAPGASGAGGDAELAGRTAVEPRAGGPAEDR